MAIAVARQVETNKKEIDVISFLTWRQGWGGDYDSPETFHRLLDCFFFVEWWWWWWCSIKRNLLLFLYSFLMRFHFNGLPRVHTGSQSSCTQDLWWLFIYFLSDRGRRME
jgi:hypothetical protein